MTERSRSWCFTTNNYSEVDWNVLNLLGCDDDRERLNIKFLCFGKEIAPKTGTPHLQGFIYFNNARTFNSVKKLLPEKSHIEKCKGSPQQNYDYCSKAVKNEDDWREFGTLPEEQGKRNDLEEIRKMVADGKGMRDIVETVSSFQQIKVAEALLKYKEKARDFMPTITWIYGATGTGKSRLAHAKHPDAYTAMATGKWFEGYDAHKAIIIDDFRKDFLPWQNLLNFFDRYEYRVETKGGSRQFLAKNIIVTCPYHPTELFAGISEDVGQLIRRLDSIIYMEYDKITHTREEDMLYPTRAKEKGKPLVGGDRLHTKVNLANPFAMKK